MATTVRQLRDFLDHCRDEAVVRIGVENTEVYEIANFDFDARWGLMIETESGPLTIDRNEEEPNDAKTSME
ncbi:MAG: hypothetical protein ACYSWP_12825 [Planctomycetota bacterium]|jgi:hypothetical protein